jgi:outer membrane lipoprotein-sorting protein
MSRLFVVATLSVLTASAFAADPEVEDLLSKMRQAYRELKTVTFQTKSQINEKGDQLTVTLDGEFMNPNKMRVAFAGLPSGEATLICDGKSVAIVVTKSIKQTLEYSVDNLGRSLFANLDTLSFFDWKRQLSTAEGGNMQKSQLKITKEDWNDRSWIVLEEHAETQKVDVRYFIDPATHMIWRTVGTVIGEKTPYIDAQITKLEINPILDEKNFVIPPK